MGRGAALAVLIAASVAGAQEAGTRLTYADLLRHMTDLDRLWAPPRAGEKCVQFASFDPGSRKGPGVQEAKPWDPKGWYANIDRGHHLRVETRAGRKEWVMAEADGPGVIVRIWSANPSGTLFFYVDGATAPTWSADFKALTSGRVAPFVEPLAGVRGRGCNFHAPIPFERRIKVTCSEHDHHYHVNVRSFPPDTRVESFGPGTIAAPSNLKAITATRASLERGASVGQAAPLSRSGTLRMDGDADDPAEWAEAAIPLEGPLVIREITVKVTPVEREGVDAASFLRRLLFCIELEGRRTVRVPVADFFGSAPAFRPYRCYALGVTEEGRGWCRFPVPIHGRGKVSLVADGPLPETRYEIGLRIEKRPLPPEALTFHASWHLRKRVRTRPFSDFRVLNAIGPGRLVGCCLVVANPSPYWWGEGDEKFFVDGESFPSTFGTGTEDYFGYAWADTHPFSSPFHAQPQCDGPENAGYTCLDRLQIHDMVPFHSSFLFDLEIWHWRDVFVDYATTAYWYGRPGASSGLPFVPDPAYRVADPIVPERVFRARGALEGESLTVRSVTGGRTEAQLMGWYTDRRWSGGRHLWWKGGRPGDRLTLEVPVSEPGRYRVEAVFTRARDYGVVQVRLNGKALGDPLDLFAPFVVEPTGRLTLGEIELPAGPVPLVLEIKGKNAKAAGEGFGVGLDYVRLVRI